LSFATEALGGERESQSLIWLLTRPLSRPAIYLAKFVAMLPWCLALNLGGFALLCSVAGRSGPMAFLLVCAAAFWRLLIFATLFVIIGVFFVVRLFVASVYSFIIEATIGNMLGVFKRIILGFSARCIMRDAAEQHGLQPEKPVVYDPVSGKTALRVLLLSTI